MIGWPNKIHQISVWNSDPVNTISVVTAEQIPDLESLPEIFLNFLDDLYIYLSYHLDDNTPIETICLTVLLDFQKLYFEPGKQQFPNRAHLFRMANVELKRSGLAKPAGNQGSKRTSNSRESPVDTIRATRLKTMLCFLPLFPRQILVFRHVLCYRYSEIENIFERTQAELQVIEKEALTQLESALAVP